MRNKSAHTQGRNRWTAAAITATTTVPALGLSGCGGGSSQGSISVADVAAAAKKAGVKVAVTAGAKDGTLTDGMSHPPEPAKPWPTGMTPDPAMPSIPANPGWTDVECIYRVGEVDLPVLVVATPAAKSALNFLLPALGYDTKTSVENLASLVKDLPKPGEVRMGPGAVPAAVVRIPVKGSGDVAMLVGQDPDDGATPLTADQIRKIAGELADEVRG